MLPHFRRSAREFETFHSCVHNIHYMDHNFKHEHETCLLFDYETKRGYAIVTYVGVGLGRMLEEIKQKSVHLIG